MFRKIDLMIIGAQKAGTTSLKNYLSEHPDIMSHPQIEFSFFNDNREYDKGFEEIFNQYFSVKDQKTTTKMVAKNVGVCSNEFAIQRLYEHNPACQIVFIIRNPVERAYSSYSMEVSNGWLKSEFNQIKDIIKKKEYDDPRFKIFIELGIYAPQIKTIEKYFPKDQIHILLFEDLKTKSAKICRSLFELLEVNPDFVPNIRKVHNKTRKVKSINWANLTMKLRDNDSLIKKSIKRILPPKVFTRISYYLLEINKSDKVFIELDKETRKFLVDFYKPYNDELQELLGPKFNISTWNK